MPTYDYKCDACGATFEKFQSMSAEPIKKCPVCGKNKARRLIGTGAGLIFKGSGFYITDYRDSKYQEKAKAEAGGGAESTANDAKSDSPTPSDAKPKAETKTESKSESKSGNAPEPKSAQSKSTKPASAKPEKK